MKRSSLAGKGKPAKASFPVVAIGASLGGLKAFSELLKHLPPDTGMAYIYVQHLNPDHKSFLSYILSKTTKMKVQEVEEMVFMKPNNVYVIPYNKGIEVTDGHIKLLPRSKSRSPLSVDVLFSSLASTHAKNVIGVVLSGNGTDGSAGLMAIKNASGITFAQDKSAQARSMPESAINAGAVDHILSPKEIALELSEFGKRGLHYKSKEVSRKGKKQTADEADADLKSLFKFTQEKSGMDFSHYKLASIKRRLHHQMIQSGERSVKDYEKRLRTNPKEVEVLCKSLLINVTSFFRDPDTFRHLKSVVLQKILKSKAPGEAFRIWIAACSTGEEAYSVAMMIAELREKKYKNIPVQLFATDLSQGAIHKARLGEYTKADMEGVSKERLKRFFTQVGTSYQINKEIREMCVFAPHNILSDPPFFRIDFISCRNLLIYFDAVAQKRVFSTLHFALNEGGVIILGKSETTGTSSHLFTQVNNKFKVYSRKKSSGVRKIPELMSNPSRPNFEMTTKPRKVAKGSVDSQKLDSAIDALVLSRYMPACAVINKEMEILQFRGAASMYLSHSPGKASLNIFKMMRPEFAFELRNAIHTAMKTKQAVVKTGIEMKIDSVMRMMTLEVAPLKMEWDEPLLLIVFTFQEAINTLKGNERESSNSYKDKKILKLTQDLNNARSEMHTVMESQETAYEELQVANEEIVSSNEEFQTLNEELETSKEEIEATNEELTSTNQELQIRNELLTESHNYSEAIIATIHEPLIILDQKLNVKSASKSFYKQFHTTREATEGHSFFELGNKQWDIPELHALLKDVITKDIDFDNFEVTHTFPGIGERVMLLNAHRILQKNHREQLTLLAIDDITERILHYKHEKELLSREVRIHKRDKEQLERAVKRRTRELETKNRELEIANKDLTSFTYISSHDLQEPLRKIKNYAAVLMLEEKENLSPQGRSYLKKTYDTTEQMRMLIEDLLKYSQTQRSELVFENTDLTLLIDQVKMNFEQAIQQKAAVIDNDKLCKIKIIPFQFRQLFQNLVSNSLKFSKEGRKPKIKITSKMETGTALNRFLRKKNYCHIVYSDNGIGFDRKYNERIFEVFQRLHTAEKFPGTGVGLAICKRIVENHNGVITATGALNKGARFDIYIPVD